LGLPDHDHVLIGRAGGIERDFHLMAEELGQSARSRPRRQGRSFGWAPPAQGEQEAVKQILILIARGLAAWPFAHPAAHLPLCAIVQPIRDRGDRQVRRA
jgi:hypothetical protein